MAAQRTKKKKLTRNLILLGLLALALYNSVYFKSLDEVTKAKTEQGFDSASAANNLMDLELASIETLDATALFTELDSDLMTTLEQKGKKLGISKEYYFMLEGDAKVLDILEENILVQLADSDKQLLIATDFIFGNAVRDATGKFDIGDYQNTMDFNNISIELNKIVREKVLPPFTERVQIGDSIHFKGAVKVNSKKPNLNEVRVIPLTLTINS